MKYIKIEAENNGAHNSQMGGGHPGEGWAVIPDNIVIPNSFPFVSLTVVGGEVTAMSEEPVPPVPEPTPAQMRETAYNTERIVEWDGELITVTEAATKWQYYAAEDSPKAAQLTALIAEAKRDIRDRYPED